MKHYLIKSINCIVSDAEIKEGDYGYWDDAGIISKVTDIKATSPNTKKIEYSNNPLEGLKGFELVDEEAEKLAYQFAIEEGKRYLEEHPFPENFPQEQADRLLTIFYKQAGHNFIAGYKAKAGYTESQMIGFAEWIIENHYEFFDDTMNGVFYSKDGMNNKDCYLMKELLILYLTEQNSKLIEVIQISENQFKIK
jgi:hypothetical protein